MPAVWGAALLSAWRTGLSSLLLGRVWRPTGRLALPLMISAIGACLAVGASQACMLCAWRGGASVRCARVTLLLGFGLLGALHVGVTVTVRGASLATWIGAALSRWQLRPAMRDQERCQHEARPCFTGRVDVLEGRTVPPPIAKPAGSAVAPACPSYSGMDKRDWLNYRSRRCYDME